MGNAIQPLVSRLDAMYQNKAKQAEWYRRRRAKFLAQGLTWAGKPRQRPLFKRRIIEVDLDALALQDLVVADGRKPK